ncbi:hypothetical protein CHLRE_04g223225v5 [Chlamydomonas reinhardtii]|uniref:Uncharacterized protein n=1 Tax=Chlamydomonas reinhardtii TaxID=3055 RepID=A0A2K3DUD1_CHLRE|nr:uncharacterized protein CHLRE_04g223225v5 [Chlamydomonas reinhardtii]PNW84150.1 hypothetical protein CHLRE_04g223225v5 [Chlamydomonas reinhardtii]
MRTQVWGWAGCVSAAATPTFSRWHLWAEMPSSALQADFCGKASAEKRVPELCLRGCAVRTLANAC